jgi:Nif-specific regulatory protein
MVFAQISQVAPSSTTVLIRGESGTGKELVAGAIHDGSPRAKRPFVSLNCAALPENLIESELFGHERGAFTGATAVRKGRFEQAQGGTLFLDEVGDLALSTQAKLLRVIQERAFERLGGMEVRRVDVRIVAATNRNLESMVESGAFRRDLYYRLNVFPIHLPPLRARRNDILLLANHFAEHFAKDNHRENVRLSLTVMDMLHRYAWPGNIRELENIIERAVLLAGRDGLILPHHLPVELHSKDFPGYGRQGALPGSSVPVRSHESNLRERLEELERAAIAEALENTSGHMGQAAAALGLTERIMALRMRKYGLRYQDYRHRENASLRNDLPAAYRPD